MPQLSQRAENLTPSPIREILSVIDRPGMISFAGGLPALETFPSLSIDNMPKHYLQYGESAGEQSLREKVCANMNAQGLICSVEQVIIVSGSQQGIDLVAKLFIDSESGVAVETPTYLAALQVFKLFGARFCSIDSMLAGSSTNLPRLLYTIPTFQNPTGYCYSQAERETLAQYCESNEIPLFEDDPYRDLVYEPCCRAPVCSFMNGGTWIYQGSFSKSYAPGMRLGFLICSTDLTIPLCRLKQAADLHSNRISQWLTMQLLSESSHDRRIEDVIALYAKRCRAFAETLDRYMAGIASWENPGGGLFFWLRLNRKLNLDLLLEQAIDNNVAFMPGNFFFFDGEPDTSCIRLNFSHADPEEADRGIRILADLIKSH